MDNGLINTFYESVRVLKSVAAKTLSAFQRIFIPRTTEMNCWRKKKKILAAVAGEINLTVKYYQ